MTFSLKTYGVFTLSFGQTDCSVEVTRTIRERRAGRQLSDAELNIWAARMGPELRDAVAAKIDAGHGTSRWIQLNLGDPHVPA